MHRLSEWRRQMVGTCFCTTTLTGRACTTLYLVKHRTLRRHTRVRTGTSHCFLRVAAGIIEAVASDFFDSSVSLVVLNQLEEDERTGKKEHVVFLVKQITRTGEAGDQDDSSRSLVAAPGSDSVPGTVSPWFPDKLWMEQQTFCQAFPFHIVFDENVSLRLTIAL